MLALHFLGAATVSPADLQIGSIAVSTTVLVKLISGVAATAILAITALTFSHEYNQEDLDDFRWPMRRAARQRQRAAEPLRLAIMSCRSGLWHWHAGQHSAASALSDQRYQHYRFRLVLAGADWLVYHGGRR
jgi:hypothetical protein